MYTTDMPTIGRPTTARQRIFALLALLADRDGPSIQATTAELAAGAYTQAEHVSRVIAELRRSGVLRRDGLGKLTVLKRDALEA